MRIPVCDEPIGLDEKEYFYDTRVEMVKSDVAYFRKLFKSLNTLDGHIYTEKAASFTNGRVVEPRKSVTLISVRKLAMHVRQVEWLLNELQNKRKQDTT